MANLSHFKFYEVQTQSAHPVKTVKLLGQFDTDKKSKTHTAVRLTHFGIPVSKNGEGIPDPRIHLSWYELAATDEPLLKVSIKNQFFEGSLEIGDPLVMLVPALKLAVTEKLKPGTPAPSGVSHFKCYRVNRGTAPAIRGGIELEDQFDVENGKKMVTQVGPAMFFCVPVSKIYLKSGGVETPPTSIVNGEFDHLVIYQIQTKPYKQQREVFDQFDEDIARLRRFGGFMSRYLAVPTKKLGWSK